MTPKLRPRPPFSPPRARGSSTEPGGLAGHLDGFVRAVREAGIPVGISQAVDAAEILTVVDLLDREPLRHGLAAVLLQGGAQRPRTTSCSTCGGRCRTGRGRRSRRRGEDADGDPGESTLDVPGSDDADLSELMRAELLRLLMDGNEEALRRFARMAVDRLGRGQPSPSGQSFFSYRVLRALSPDTLVSQLLAGLLGRGGPRGAGRAGGAADGAGATGRVPGRDRGGGAPADGGGEGPGQDREERRSDRWPTRWTSSGRRPATSPSCAGRSPRWPGGWPSGCRPGAGSGGRAGWTSSKTVRASLGTGGMPVVTHHRPRKVHKPELVVLCDVSGSVAGFSHFTLMLTQALREHFTGVRAFAFVDTTDEVTRFFRPGADVVDAVARIGREAEWSASTGTATTGPLSRCSPTGGRRPWGRRRRC